MHYILISKSHLSKMKGVVSTFYRTLRRLESSCLLQGVTTQGKGVCRTPTSSRTIKKKKNKSYVKMFLKCGLIKLEGKMVEQSHTWTMMNLCPSLLCLSQQAITAVSQPAGYRHNS